MTDQTPLLVVLEPALPSVFCIPDVETPQVLALIAQGAKGLSAFEEWQILNPGGTWDEFIATLGGGGLQREAGEDMSALRIVYEEDGKVFYLDPADGAHVFQLLGITTSSTATGGQVSIQFNGAVDDASWTWALGPVWLGLSGSLTQIPPADGFDVLVGAAVSATRLVLNLQDPIDLTE